MDRKDEADRDEIDYIDAFGKMNDERYENIYHQEVMDEFNEQLNGRYLKKRTKKTFTNGTMWGGIILGVIISSIVFVVSSVFVHNLKFFRVGYNKNNLTASGDPAALPDEVFDQKVEDIQKLIEDNFIFEYKKSQLQDGILKGLVQSLEDPYSQYYTAQEFKKAMEQYNGEYTGIGIVVRQSEDKRGIVILNVYSGSPAEKAGLKSGDIIVEVEGEELMPEVPFEQIISKIKGKKGTSVSLKIIRENERKTRAFKVLRDSISIDSVRAEMLESNIGYIRVYEFSSHTTDEFDKAYDRMVKEGAKKLIIDLRDNPGGSFTTVCQMLDGFLSDGVIVYTQDKVGHREYVRANKAVKYKLPIAVLINRNSASASEIFSGTVKDRQLGVLVGEKTYGKGIVQNTIPFSDGTALKLTISRYYTASGKEIHEKGIAPDIKVIYRQPKIRKDKNYTYKDDNQIMRAIKVLG